VGILEGPGTVAVSAGLAKSMAIRENMHLRFEATFTNVLNRTNYAPPATNVSSPSTFGVLNAQQTAETRAIALGNWPCVLNSESNREDVGSSLARRRSQFLD